MVKRGLAVGIVGLALLGAGCGKEESVPGAKKFNTGSLVRVVNLTDKELVAQMGPYNTATCKAWDRSAFSRIPPRKVDFTLTPTGNSAEKMTLELKPSIRYSIYSIQRAGGKIEYVTIENDPKDAGEGKVIFRAISFDAKDVDFTVTPASGSALEAKAVKAGTPSSEMESTPQSFTVTASVAGKKIAEASVEAASGETYTLAITGNGKPELKVILNNPPMLATPGGASAAG